VRLRSGVMKMVSKSLYISVLAATLAASPASAAEGNAQLTSISGKVLVNLGAGFVQPTRGMDLKSGDRIFVGQDASALITYVGDNCQVTVPADRVATVDILSPCQNKTVQIQPTADMPRDVQAYEPEFPILPVVAILGAGVIACVIACDFDDDDKPDSPGDGDQN
jgi:hypothetical protein